MKLDTVVNKSIFLGDFNRNFNKTISQVLELVDIFECYGLSQRVLSDTRVTTNSATLIDHVYTNICPTSCHVDVIAVGVSDHYAQQMVMELHNKFPVANAGGFRTVRPLRPDNVEHLRERLVNEDWIEMSDMNSVNDKAHL